MTVVLGRNFDSEREMVREEKKWLEKKEKQEQHPKR
jgi:hypothetical protein